MKQRRLYAARVRKNAGGGGDFGLGVSAKGNSGGASATTNAVTTQASGLATVSAADTEACDCTEACSAAAVPASVKNWMLLAIATAYEHRAELLAGVTVSALVGRFVDRLLDRERVYAPTDEDDDA